MLTHLIYLAVLATAAFAQFPKWLFFQAFAVPSTPTVTDTSNYYFMSYSGGKYPRNVTNGEEVFMERGKEIYIAQAWEWQPNGPTQDSNTLFGPLKTTPFQNGQACLDAGLDPQEGSKVKLWQCYANHAPQMWTLGVTEIRLAGTNLCLLAAATERDAYRSVPQLQECSCGSPGQIWRTRYTLYPER